MLKKNGFIIETLDSNLYSIETSKSLSVTVSEPSDVSYLSITSSNTTINVMNSLNVVFKTSNFKPKGAILEMTFPSEFKISELTLNSVTGLSKIETNVLYTINGNVLKMTNAINDYYSSSEIHYFRISFVKNPVLLIN